MGHAVTQEERSQDLGEEDGRPPVGLELLGRDLCGHLVDDVDATLVPVALDDLARHRCEVAVGLDRHDGLCAEARCDDREQTGAGADLEHDALGGDDTAQRIAIELVARVVVHHRVVPVIRCLDQLIRFVPQPLRHDEMLRKVVGEGALFAVAVPGRPVRPALVLDAFLIAVLVLATLKRWVVGHWDEGIHHEGASRTVSNWGEC